MERKKRLHWQKIVSFALCLALLLAVFPPATASAKSVAELDRELAELRDEQAALKKKQSETKRKLKIKRKKKMPTSRKFPW